MSKNPIEKMIADAKVACPGAILLFKIGDFYEAFGNDAITICRTLGLVLTSRAKADGSLTMAGFSYHQLEAYLRKLVADGYRVAICEQVDKAPVGAPVVRHVGEGSLVA